MGRDYVGARWSETYVHSGPAAAGAARAAIEASTIHIKEVLAGGEVDLATTCWPLTKPSTYPGTPRDRDAARLGPLVVAGEERVRTICAVSHVSGEGGPAVYALAPWAQRRGRLVQLALVGGSIALAAVLLATLYGTEGFGAGIGLAVGAIALGLGMTWYLRRMTRRVRLVVGEDGIQYDAGTHRIAAAWEDVAALDLVIRGADTGPALVLRGDRAVSGGGMLSAAEIGQAIQETGPSAPSLKSTIPLSAFIEGELAGSPLEADLRGRIPELVDAYFARYGGAPTR